MLPPKCMGITVFSVGNTKMTLKSLDFHVFVNRDNNGIEPLEVIYSKCPAALNEVFNSAVMCKVGDPMDQNLTVNFDFGYVRIGDISNLEFFDISLFNEIS